MVIWGLGAIALLVLSFAATGRLRLQSAFNAAGAQQARLFAAAATNIAIVQLVREQVDGEAPRHDGAPAFCSIDDAVVVVSIEDESGKIDLNAASEPLLRDVFGGLAGLAPAQAEAAARAVAQFRTPASSGVAAPVAGKPFVAKSAPIKSAPLQSALELDQVAGLDQVSVQALLPFVTVYSLADGLDPNRAPPALFAALLGLSRREIADLAARPFPNALDRGDPRFPRAYRRKGDANDVFTIHVEARLVSGMRGSSVSIVDLRATDAPYALREIHTGPPRFSPELDARSAAELPRC